MGIIATRLIRPDTVKRGTPIIALTAQAMHGDDKIGLAAGMDGSISKSISQDKLFETVRTFIVRQGPSRVELVVMENVVMDEDVLPKKMPGLNIEEALTRIGIPAEVFKTIILKFAEVNGDKVAAMRQGLQEGRLADVGLMAHALKGASGNIGADLLYAAALAVDTAVKTGVDVEELATAVDVLSAELEVVLTSLATLRVSR